MKMISRKKQTYPLSDRLHSYLQEMQRSCHLEFDYEDLLRFSDYVPLLDKSGQDTLWITVSYPHREWDELNRALLYTYAQIRSEGDFRNIENLFVDRIDLCLYGNTRPFRVRIVNRLNENFDYFYVKYADSSRVLGLELEHILSPNRIEFLVSHQTLVEEHIMGIPGDTFALKYMDLEHHNPVRIAKEFVKFNERSFLKLLGDMHAANFIVDITIDIEEYTYRLRALDFDQQCYESSLNTYRPQFYLENRAYVDLVAKHLPQESITQYQREERALIHKRMATSRYRFGRLMETICSERLAPAEHVHRLRGELAKYYGDARFNECESMGELVLASLQTLEH